MTYRRTFITRYLTTCALLSMGAGSLGCSLEDDHPEHGELERIELESRGATPVLLAVWTDDDGWEDADGEPLAELPPAVVDGDELVPLRAGGDHASITARFFDHDGDEIEMATLSRDDATGERECTEDSVRYFPLDDDTDIIAWPPVAHPDSPDGSFQFVERSGGEVAGIYHCDHIDIYPESEGTVELEIVLWHDGHGDDHSDPLTVRVEAAE